MDAIKNFIDKFKTKKNISKGDRVELNELIVRLENVKALTENDRENIEALVTTLRELIGRDRITVGIIDKITKFCDEINKDMDDMNDVDNEDDDSKTETETETISSDVIEYIEEENLERKLDMQCPRYNKFTKSNPAEYVSYNKSKGLYRFKYQDIDKTSKKLANIIKIAKNTLLPSNAIQTGKIWEFKKISYKGKRIIIYTDGVKPYFDINNTIELFDDMKAKDKKYNAFKNKIVKRDFRDNQYGGFYIKEFITKQTFFDILLNTKSIFAKEFKKDVSRILDKLTNSGGLVIENDTLKLAQDKEPQLVEINKYNDPPTDQTYDNEDLIQFILRQIDENRIIDWEKYMKKHMMYFTVTNIKDPSGKNRIVSKIGYTTNLEQRLTDLTTTYKAEFYLIGVKFVDGKFDEIDFHKRVKKAYPHLVIDLTINGRKYDKFYAFDTKLYNDFNKLDDNDNGEYIKLIHKELREMYEYFAGMKRSFLTSYYDIKSASYYDYLIAKEQEETKRLIAIEEIKRVRIQEDTKIKLKEMELNQV